jgi:hypothetical protein
MYYTTGLENMYTLCSKKENMKPEEYRIKNSGTHRHIKPFGILQN